MTESLSLDGQVSPDIKVRYLNWRGETAVRTLRPISLHYKATKWHTEAQWLMLARDLDKNVDRLFALKDMVLLNE